MILVYSVAPANPIRIPAHIQIISRPYLQCFYQVIEQPPAKDKLHEEAVRFFEANRRIHAQTDILEFRFPTLLSDEQALREFLDRNETQLAAELSRLSGNAQITVYLLDNGDSNEAPASGTEYLQARREKFATRERLVREILDIAGEDVIDKLERADRLLILVRRSKAHALIERLSDIPQTRVAGPFPPSGFAKLLS